LCVLANAIDYDVVAYQIISIHFIFLKNQKENTVRTTKKEQIKILLRYFFDDLSAHKL
jgi:hypothetical protein